jgi:hypothetical protein
MLPAVKKRVEQFDFSVTSYFEARAVNSIKTGEGRKEAQQ